MTTWNHYLNRIKLFVRWYYNYYLKKEQNLEINEEWTTPDFCKIKTKQTKRISPYLESEIWQRAVIYDTCYCGINQFCAGNNLKQRIVITIKSTN